MARNENGYNIGIHQESATNGVRNKSRGACWQFNVSEQKREGKGMEYAKGEIVYEGHWKGGKRHGDGIEYEEGEIVYEGRWNGGKRTPHYPPSEDARKEAEEGDKKRRKKTELEKTLDQALSNDNWGASAMTMYALAQASYNDNDYKVISDAIWSTIASQPKYWKKIFKALNLIDHLIRNGSPRIIDDTRDRIEKLRALQEFSFKEQQYERGNGIREKASLIIELLAAA